MFIYLAFVGFYLCEILLGNFGSKTSTDNLHSTKVKPELQPTRGKCNQSSISKCATKQTNLMASPRPKLICQSSWFRRFACEPFALFICLCACVSARALEFNKNLLRNLDTNNNNNNNDNNAYY